VSRVDFLLFFALQATVNTIVDVQTYIDQYKPDASVLLLRHPAHNLKSISTKFYRDIAGSPGQKFIGEENPTHTRLHSFIVRSDLFFLVTLECHLGNPVAVCAALEDAFVRRSNLFDLTIAYEDIFRYREKVVRGVRCFQSVSTWHCTPIPTSFDEKLSLR